LVAAASGQPLPLPEFLLISSVICVVVASIGVLGVYRNRRDTRQWADTNPLDGSRRAVYQRTFYAVWREKAWRYIFGFWYVVGAALLIASGLAELLGWHWCQAPTRLHHINLMNTDQLG
jgi:hypothetical protein